jgi:hypothetical protein
MLANRLSLLLGLTTSATLAVSFPAQAGIFNFDSLQYIKTRPLASNDALDFFGSVSRKEGYTGFFNLDPNAPDRGHIEIAKNSPGNIAPYYTTGRDRTPEVPSLGSTRSATLEDGKGFSNFFKYINDNNIDLDAIGMSYGQKSGVNFTESWNLGEDKLGQDWFGSSDSTLEERIYRANPDDVEIVLSFGTTKFIDFGYSDFYSLLEYGATTSIADDSEAILSDPFTAKKVFGLNPLLDGLADAFLKDLGDRRIQAVHESAAVADVNFSMGNGYGVAAFDFPLSLRAVSVSVPEPSVIVGLLTFGTISAVLGRKKERL